MSEFARDLQNTLDEFSVYYRKLKLNVESYAEQLFYHNGGAIGKV